MKNTFGNALGLTIFGESHGAAVGAVLDGLAAGLPVDEAYIAERMDRRRARGDGLSTARTEPDVVEFLSGVVNGHTTGTPITMMIRNTNTRSGDYAKTADLLRPGHADCTAYAKYEGWQDARGGGHFSGRITAASVAAGSICEHILAQRGIKVYTHIARCAGVEDAPLSSSAGLIMAEPQPGHFALLDPEKEAPMQAAIRAVFWKLSSPGCPRASANRSLTVWKVRSPTWRLPSPLSKALSLARALPLRTCAAPRQTTRLPCGTAKW